MQIRNAIASDAPAIAAIYNHYVINSTISFEEEPVSDTEMAQRVAGVQSAGLPWLVIESGDGVLGYAYAAKWRVRPAYRHSVETSVYLAHGSTGAGLGMRLYRALLDQLRQAGYHMAIGGIALPNAASVALHEKAGYEKVAHFAEVGLKFGERLDVGYWQLKLAPASGA